ncbi:acyl carrier protein [Erwinia tasmaniensis]|uniref:acyl carrier protein n=1 Tax=Erwinia tasmaniensis TaxID=338565 RepID=UPI003A4DE9F8
MRSQQELLAVVLDIINEIMKTGFTPETVDMESFLGGELGVNSVEMLEAWYGIEKQLNIRVNDGEKRDIYTLGDLIRVIQQHLPAQAQASAFGS